MTSEFQPRRESNGAFPFKWFLDMCPGDLNALQERIGYRFRELPLLVHALVHPSVVESLGRAVSNQRLEYLGDAVLELLSAGCVYEAYPDMAEGDMTRLRASVVSENPLADLACGFGLDSCVIMSKGLEKDGGRTKKSILSDAMEAVIAAMYLDGGMDAVEKTIRPHLLRMMREIRPHLQEVEPKSQLQEILQAEKPGVAIEYRTLDETGPSHLKVFTVGLYVDGELKAQGEGPSKHKAQTAAAANYLKELQ